MKMIIHATIFAIFGISNLFFIFYGYKYINNAHIIVFCFSVSISFVMFFFSSLINSVDNENLNKKIDKNNKEINKKLDKLIENNNINNKIKKCNECKSFECNECNGATDGICNRK